MTQLRKNKILLTLSKAQFSDFTADENYYLLGLVTSVLCQEYETNR